MKLKDLKINLLKVEALEKEHEVLYNEHLAIQRLLSGDYIAQKDNYSGRYSLGCILIVDLALISYLQEAVKLFPVKNDSKYWNDVVLEATPEILERLDWIESRLSEITSELESEV